ncbi:MAG TPA: M50 family metallopeptidase [Pirellulales bacterium]|nr:M50 family metallopeptidase [Pirellulales bacterium]
MRFRALVFATLSTTAAWLAMTAVHELGHVLTARLSGGRVMHVELPPRGLGHTQVSRNPHPRLVAWGGPLGGSLMGLAPLIFLRRSEVARWLARFFGGFCLIANGAYVGVGAFLGDPNGADDAHELLRHGAPLWQLALFGLATGTAGLGVWHRLGPAIGFIRASSLAGPRTFAALAALIVALLALGWL